MDMRFTMLNNKNNWNPIPNYDGIYKISREGVLFNTKSFTFSNLAMKPSVSLTSHGKTERHQVQELIRRSFGGRWGYHYHDLDDPVSEG